MRHWCTDYMCYFCNAPMMRIRVRFGYPMLNPVSNSLGMVPSQVFERRIRLRFLATSPFRTTYCLQPKLHPKLWKKAIVWIRKGVLALLSMSILIYICNYFGVSSSCNSPWTKGKYITAKSQITDLQRVFSAVSGLR